MPYGSDPFRTVLSRRWLLASPVAAAAALSLFDRAGAEDATPLASPAPVPSSSWNLPDANLSATRAVTSSIDSSNVATLLSAWSVDLGGTASGTPVIADGVVFVTTWEGDVLALDLSTGATHWSYPTNASVEDPLLGAQVGIPGGATVSDGVVYVGDAAGTLHAIDAATGKANWTVRPDDQSAAAITAAPAILDGQLLVPIANITPDDTFRGSLVALSASDGSIIWQRYFAVESGQGGGAASTPSIDPDQGAAYLTVASSNAAPSSIFALDFKTGDVIWQSAIETTETDLPAPGASVNLFSIELDGTARAVAGAGFPDGVYRAVDRVDGTLLWEFAAARGGPFGGIQGTAAVSDGMIVVPATNWPTLDAPASGAIMASTTDSGTYQWLTIQSAPALAPVSIAGDIVFSGGLDGTLRADLLADGTHLWSETLDASIGTGIAVLDRTIVFGTGAPNIGAFVKPGTSLEAYALVTSGTPVPSAAGEPEASPTAQIVDTPTLEPTGKVFEATMDSLKFIPETIEISAGTTVTWTNEDEVAHTVTHKVKVEDQLFSSPLLTNGQTFSYTFDKPGTYPIYCMPHPFMSETVIVS